MKLKFIKKILNLNTCCLVTPCFLITPVLNNINQEQNLQFWMPTNLEFDGIVERTDELHKNYSYSDHYISGGFIPHWKITLTSSQVEKFVKNKNYSCSLAEIWNKNTNPQFSNINLTFPKTNDLHWKETNWGSSHINDEGLWKDSGNHVIDVGHWEDWKTYSMRYQGRCQPFTVISYKVTLKCIFDESKIYLTRQNNKIYFETDTNGNSWSIYFNNSDKGKGFVDLGWKNPIAHHKIIYDFDQSHIDKLNGAFDVNNIITIDKTKTKWWTDTESGDAFIHPSINANSDYLEACLGSWQASYWANNNNWINDFVLPSEVKDYFNSHLDIVNTISESLQTGLLWDSTTSKVNNYLFPNTAIDLFEQKIYQNTGTFDNPAQNNNYSLAFHLSDAYQNRLTAAQIKQKLPTIAINWKALQNKYNYSFNFNNYENFLESDGSFLQCIKDFCNSDEFTNQKITIKYSFYKNDEEEDPSGAYVYSNTHTNTYSLIELLDGVALEQEPITHDSYAWISIDSCTHSNNWSPYYADTDKTFNFDYSHADYKTLFSVGQFKEVDAIENLDDAIYQGQSILLDQNNNKVDWTNDLFRTFIETCKFLDTEELIEMLTAGTIRLDAEPCKESPLYNYSVTNINSSMFCEVYDEWQPFFGNDVTKLVKSCEFSKSVESENLINIKLTTNEGDVINFDSSGWWNIEEILKINEDSSSFPDFSNQTTDDFLKTINESGLLLLESYCSWYNSAPEQFYIFKSNLTFREFSFDIQNLENPIELINDHDNNIIIVNIKHHKFFNKKDPSGVVVQETITLDGFKKWVPPSPTPTPIENPISIGLIVGITCAGVLLISGLIFLEIRRRRRSVRSMVKIKNKQETTKTLEEILKEKQEQQEE